MQFSLLPAGVSDTGFLYRLFESICGRQFAKLALPSAEREALIRMHFNAQQAGYREQCPASQERFPNHHRLYSRSSEYQGRGLGTSMLIKVMEDAALAVKAIRLQVDRRNLLGARLYCRLGSEVILSKTSPAESVRPR